MHLDKSCSCSGMCFFFSKKGKGLLEMVSNFKSVALIPLATSEKSTRYNYSIKYLSTVSSPLPNQNISLISPTHHKKIENSTT